MMGNAGVPAGEGNPFTIRTALIMVLFGAMVFVLMLYLIGAGMSQGPANNGGNHAGGKGLTGFAAMSGFLERRGYQVRRSRSEGAIADPGLLVLTPPHMAKAEKIDEILDRREYVGPTLLVLPKWLAAPVPAAQRGAKAKEGWVTISGVYAPAWAEELETLGPLDLKTGKAAGGESSWSGLGASGTLPDAKAQQTMSSGSILALVRNGRGQTLAGFLDDGSSHPALEDAAGEEPALDDEYESYPVVIVADPDLLNNYGFSRREGATLAFALVRASMDGEDLPVIFDMTLNGLGRSTNLLTLAFTPPFLAATLCLLMAALAIGWRAFMRFGPPRKPGRAIAFGKRALVANTSGLLRRARRLHLMAEPYIGRARERIARALALPRHAGNDATDAAIDRALASRSPGSPPFTELAARLRSERDPQQIVKAAHDLFALERTLTR